MRAVPVRLSSLLIATAITTHMSLANVYAHALLDDAKR